MNEDWLHKVHDRMADYEIGEPENLWNAIESKRAELSSASRPVKRPVMIWVKRSLAVAAMIAAIFTLCICFFKIDRPLSAPRLITLAPANTHAEFSASSQLSEFSESSEFSAPSQLSESSQPSQLSAPSEFSESSELSEFSAPSELSEFSAPSQLSESSDPSPLPPVASGDYIAAVRPKSSSSSRVSVSVYSGGASSGLNNPAKYDDMSNLQSVWTDNLLMGISHLGVAEEYESDIKHRLPIRAGLSVTYNLTPRLGLETGLNYTTLISDVREGSSNQYFTGQQKLRYIGIPLNIKYRFFSWKRFDLYASAGAMAEKCVSAKLHKEFITNRHSSGSESVDLGEKPLQWSVNASLGVQCNVLNSMSVFAEPGISHYFDDGSALQTIYKDKALNFNLNMGIRFTFGK